MTRIFWFVSLLISYNIQASQVDMSLAQFGDLERRVVGEFQKNGTSLDQFPVNFDEDVRAYVVGLTNKNVLGDNRLTQYEIAEILRICQSTVNRFINGKNCPAIHKRFAWLCKNFDENFRPSQVKIKHWNAEQRALTVEETEALWSTAMKRLLMPASAKMPENISTYLQYLIGLSSRSVVDDVLLSSSEAISKALQRDPGACRVVFTSFLTHYRGSKEAIPYSRLVIEKQRELDAKPKPAPKESWVPRWIGGCFGLMSEDNEGYAAHHTSGYARASNNIPADQRPLLTSGADKKRD